MTATVTPSPTPAKPTVTTVDMNSAFRWVAPALHYALAVALMVGAVLHQYFVLPKWATPVLVALAVVCVVAGTIFWMVHEKVSLQNAATWLRSQVPSLIADVENLKAQAPASLPADELAQITALAAQVKAWEALAEQLLHAQGTAEPDPEPPAPAPVVAQTAPVPEDAAPQTLPAPTGG